jgi:hypothetical protein
LCPPCCARTAEPYGGDELLTSARATRSPTWIPSAANCATSGRGQLTLAGLTLRVHSRRPRARIARTNQLEAIAAAVTVSTWTPGEITHADPCAGDQAVERPVGGARRDALRRRRGRSRLWACCLPAPERCGPPRGFIRDKRAEPPWVRLVVRHRLLRARRGAGALLARPAREERAPPRPLGCWLSPYLSRHGFGEDGAQANTSCRRSVLDHAAAGLCDLRRRVARPAYVGLRPHRAVAAVREANVEPAGLHAAAPSHPSR